MTSSTQGIKTVLHPVSDVATAKAVYAALLGVEPQTDDSYYVGFEAAGQHIGLVPGGGPQAMTSPVAYWHVPDIEAKLAEVTAAGATVKEPRTTSVAAACGHRHGPRRQCAGAVSGSVSADPPQEGIDGAHQSCIDPSRRRLTGRYLGSYGNLAAASSLKLTPKPGSSPGCMYPSRKA